MLGVGAFAPVEIIVRSDLAIRHGFLVAAFPAALMNCSFEDSSNLMNCHPIIPTPLNLSSRAKSRDLRFLPQAGCFRRERTADPSASLGMTIHKERLRSE